MGSANGHKAEHVADRHMEAATDGAIWTYAIRAAAAIVSKDEDFAQRKVRGRDGPVVIWVRLPNTRRRDLLVWFDVALPQILSAVECGETLVELI